VGNVADLLSKKLPVHSIIFVHSPFLSNTVDPMHLFEGGWCASVAKAFVRPLRTRVRMELDILLERIRISSRSSVRDRFPRINFSGDVTSMTK
jgi:hypothetical protein